MQPLQNLKEAFERARTRWDVSRFAGDHTVTYLQVHGRWSEGRLLNSQDFPEEMAHLQVCHKVSHALWMAMNWAAVALETAYPGQVAGAASAAACAEEVPHG